LFAIYSQEAEGNGGRKPFFSSGTVFLLGGNGVKYLFRGEPGTAGGTMGLGGEGIKILSLVVYNHV
jgi:hypothetical protein